jgi:hypothetical protein
MMDVKIRFNTNYPNRSDKKWRAIINGVEQLVDEVEIRCESHSSEDIIEVDGKSVTKYHIACTPKFIEVAVVNEQKNKFIFL